MLPLLCLLLVVWALPNTPAEGATLTITDPYADDVQCTGDATLAQALPLANNQQGALTTLRGWCAADPRCAELYAQDGAPNLQAFVHLFQTTLPGSVNDVYLESPLLDLLCNRTIEEFLQQAWALVLVAQMLDAGVCDVNERFVYNSAAGSGSCVCQPGKVCTGTGADGGKLALEIIVVVAVVLAVAVQAGAVYINRSRLAIFARGRSRATPVLSQAPFRAPPRASNKHV